MKRFLKYLYPFAVAAFFALTIVACSKSNETKTSNSKPVIITASGNITSSVDEFRKLLGDPLNLTTGNTTGRREINWDAVPDQFMNASIPKDFFNLTNAGDPVSRKKGFAYAEDGDFRISNSGFSNVEPSLSSQLTAFSGDKVFANVSSVAWHTEFEVAGEAKAASVHGFGAVFSDVDIANTSFLEYFAGDSSVGKVFAPVHDAATNLSFVGAYYKDVQITRVLIHHGTGTIISGNKDISNGGTLDLVAMDDFLYDEPKAIK